MVKKRTFKKNVVASWGITYFVIFVIPIVLFFFFIAIFMSIIDGETSYYNGLAVEHVKFTMDSIFADVNASATELFMDEDFDDISQYEEFRDIPAYLLFQQVSSLQRVDTTKSYIDGLIVYSPSMDLYISTVRYGRLSRIHSLMEYNLQLTQEEATEMATWANNQNNGWGFVMSDNDPNAEMANNETCFGFLAKQAAYDSTICLYDPNENPIFKAFVIIALLWHSRSKYSFPISAFMRRCVLRTMAIFLISACMVYFLPISGCDNFLDFAISSLVIFTTCAALVYFIGITKNEAAYIKNMIVSKLHLKH